LIQKLKPVSDRTATQRNLNADAQWVKNLNKIEVKAIVDAKTAQCLLDTLNNLQLTKSLSRMSPTSPTSRNIQRLPTEWAKLKKRNALNPSNKRASLIE
jgi:hypothetical protein